MFYLNILVCEKVQMNFGLAVQMKNCIFFFLVVLAQRALWSLSEHFGRSATSAKPALKILTDSCPEFIPLTPILIKTRVLLSKP
jgi:hypothetical protein